MGPGHGERGLLRRAGVGEEIEASLLARARRKLRLAEGSCERVVHDWTAFGFTLVACSLSANTDSLFACRALALAEGTLRPAY
jgi:hypothetical protein